MRVGARARSVGSVGGLVVVAAVVRPPDRLAAATHDVQQVHLTHHTRAHTDRPSYHEVVKISSFLFAYDI